VPERRQVFSTLNVLDNLLLGAYLRRGRDKKDQIRSDLDFVFDIFPVLKDRQKQMGGTLSGGEQQMLAVGRGLMAKPKLLLLDEPSLGLAPLLVREIFRVAGELRDHGTTILLVEQNARAALRLADRGYVLETGEVVVEGTSAELLSDKRVQEAYLGGSGS
jgi:branched-chain amino acid transport system ATP-binding protein